MRSRRAQMTRGLGPRLYGVLAAIIGSVGIGLLAFFLTDQRGSIRVDGPATKALTVAALIDAGLVLLFGLQHSLMARPSVKRWVARVLPESGVRSTYVMMSGLMLILLLWAVLMCFSRLSGHGNLRLHLPQENFRNELVLVEFLPRATGSTRTLFAIGTWVPPLPRS